MAEMISVREAAVRWNITERRVATLCKNGRIAGAKKQGNRWLIPADTQKPADQRLKTGAFRKTERAPKLPLPIGVSNYCLASSEYYYIDKTMMIKDFIDERPMVTLFTRPRRFGKTLNMDMLRTYFEKSDKDTSVYFRDKKIWACGQKYRDYAVLNYSDAEGQRKTKWVALGLPEKGNKRKAEAELARLRAEFEPPKEVGDLSSDMLFADYLMEWLEIAKGRLAVATYSSYATMINKPIGPYFRKKNLTLRNLEARHLQMFYSEMLRKVKANTVIHYHAIIHSALKYAVKTDMLIQNAADKVDRPRKNSFQPVFLSAEEMQKMFEALRGTKLELPVLVAAFYGFRRGEVLGLKWDAIDFEQGTISVKRTVTSTIIDGKYQEFEQQSAKTKSSLRTLPLIGSFREYFMQVKEAQGLNKQVCGNCYNYEYDGYVFVNELGERMRPSYLTEYFPKYIAKHGMPKMRFHDLRHPYVKHTTKNKSLQKQKSQATKNDSLGFLLLLAFNKGGA